MTNTVKEDLKFAGQLSLCGESLKLAVQIYADMLDSGYQPTNYRNLNTLPKPDTYFGRTPVWKTETAEAWVQSRRRLSPKQTN